MKIKPTWIAGIGFNVLGLGLATHLWNVDIRAIGALDWILGVTALAFFGGIGDKLIKK